MNDRFAVGSVFAGHRIEKVVARGGMGVILRATQLRPARPVALKLVAPALLEDSTHRERFKRESEIAASIDHPNVIPIYQTGDEGGLMFIAMRWVEGTDLAALLAEGGPLDPGRAAHLVAQVAAALDAAHAHGLVHRDVKPANVLLAAEDHVYLTDFGLSRHAVSEPGIRPVTRAGRWVGTLDYVAPEQIEGRPVDARTDVYALGCVLYELLTGTPPFARETELATLWAHVHAPAPSVLSASPDVPAEFDSVVERATAKDPDARFASAGGLAEAAMEAAGWPRREPQSPAGPRTDGEPAVGARPARAATAAPTRMPFDLPLPGALEAATRRGVFGRDPELELLRQALAEAHTGARRGALLAGDAGIGKTSLAALVAKEAHMRGTAVLYGRCYEDLPVPYRPFAEALGHLVQHAPRELVEGQVRDHAGVLTHMVPQLAKRLDTGEDAPVATQGDLYMLFSAAASLLSEASARAPLMIVLDDLHWADAQTIPLLRYLLTGGVEMSALIVGTYRTSELGRDHPLRALVTDLLNEAAVTRIELGGLSEQAVIEMTAARARERLDPNGVRLARAVYEETMGNPFFAIEILRHLVESRKIVRTDGHWSTPGEIGDLAMPDSIVETINRRVARLANRAGERVREVLTTASAMGTEIDPALLSTVLETDLDEVLELLDGASEARLLSRSPTGDGYAFSHALVGQALYEQLGKAARRRLHRRIAESLEAMCGADPGPRIGELARHWLASFEPQVAGKALDYVRQAGDYALEKLAPDEALRLYSSALERHDKHPEGGERMHCELVIGLGSAQRQLGRAEFRDTLLEAAHAARRIGATDLLVRAAGENTRGFVSETGEVDGERVAMLRAALDALTDADGAERSRLLSTLAAELTFARDWPRPLELSNEALATARQLGDPKTLSDVLSARFMATWTPETLPERYANTAEELQLVEATGGDRLARFWALHWRATACIERGELHEAERRIAEEGQIADRIGQPTARWLAAYDRATAALIRGELAEAETCALEAGRIGKEGAQPEAEAFYGGQLVNIRFEQGRLIELEGMIEHEAHDKPGIPAFWAALALARAEAGDLEGARSTMAMHAADGFASFPYDPNWLVGLCLYAETCGHVGDRVGAAALEPLLAPWTGQVAFNSATVWGFVARHAGVLDRVLGRHDRAVERLEQAETQHERIDAPLWLARARLDLGQALLDRAGRGDADRAGRLLERALERGERHGCATIAERAAALLDQVGESGPSAHGNGLAGASQI